MAWIGGALALGGALISSGSAGDAADTQAGATASATAEQRRQFDLNRSDLAPYRDAGGAAINKLSQLMGLQPSATGASGDWRSQLKQGYQDWFSANPGANPDVLHGLINRIDDAQSPSDLQAGGQNGVFEFAKQTGVPTPNNIGDVLTALKTPPPTQQQNAADPEFGSLTKKFTLADFWDDPVTKASYQQGLDQGTKALQNMAGARGNRNSGAQLKALERFTTDYTGNQAGQSQARYVNDQTNLFNRYSGLAGTGQAAANTTVAAGTNAANTIGGLMTAQGNARGAAQIAGGNAISGALTGAGNYYNQQNTLNKILGGGGYGGGYSNNSPIDPYTYSSNYG